MLDDDHIVDAVELLAREAFADEGVVDEFRGETFAQFGEWRPPHSKLAAREWLDSVRRSDLRPYEPPAYFAEREGYVERPPAQGRAHLEEAFVALIGRMQEDGYFPRALPRECVDNSVDYEDVSDRIQRATKLTVKWPLSVWAGSLPEASLFSLMEYFHDHAERPRVMGYIHTFGQCGPHYDAHDRDSGRVVYRWRLNELLDEYSVGYRLGSIGEERGRLIRRFPSPIGELADRQMQARQDEPGDEVAHAIRDFRKRDAGLPEKRSAIRALSHALEPRREEIGTRLTKKDESDLFRIVNTFTIRHNKPTDRNDYGDEFLDWIFWTHLATVDLLDQLDARDGKK